MQTTSVSKINTLITSDYIQTKNENQYFERKGLGEKDTKPTKLAEEIIGMLNADGGVLVFGISDTGEFQDLNTISEKTLNQYRTLCIDYIHPACNVVLEEITVNNQLIFLYHVEQDHERLYARKDNDQVFLRVLDTNRKLDRTGIKKLEYDKTIRQFEEEYVTHFEQTDLNTELLNDYKLKLNYEGNALDLLCKRYLAKNDGEQYVLKNSAVLLFAKDPEKYIPSASLRYIRYEGEDALSGSDFNVVKDQRFENNIPKLLEQIIVFLNATFRDYYFFDLTEGKFKKVPEYPEDAWLEGLVNALCHRSYNVQGSSIYIKHFDDRLEISNSGPLPAQVTIANIKTERFARNPRIARVLEDMGYVRQLNEGVSRIYASMEKSMLSLPEYKETNGTVYLILRNKISQHSKTIHDSIINKIESDWINYNQTQQNILAYLLANNGATKDTLAEYCNTHKNTIARNLNTLLQENIIERNSEKQRDSDARYTFKKQ
jgi:ATP-dependent DNA helicase RecG